MELHKMIASSEKRYLSLNATQIDNTLPNYLQYPEISSDPNNVDQYDLINVTPSQRSVKQLREVTHTISVGTLNQTIPTNIRPHAYCYERKKRRRKKNPLFLPLKAILSKVFPKPRKTKYKDRRKFYNCTKKCYEDNPEYHLAYLMQEYNIAYNGNIFPTRKRLAEELQVSERIVDKALKNLKSEEDLYVQSGKKTWTTNQYFLPIKYQKHPLIAPPDYKSPKILHMAINRKFTKAKCPELKRWIGKLFRRQKDQFAHYSFQEIKKLRSSLKKGVKISSKKTKDPPKKRKKPPNWHLLSPLKLSFKDHHILSRYSEALLRAAIDDLHAYAGWGKTIENKAAFLMSRCKAHQLQRQAKAEAAKPENLKNWITTYLTSFKNKISFINSKAQLDPATTDLRPHVELKLHKEDIKKSVLKIYQKVHGSWVDKFFQFDRPDLVEAIESYIENSLI